MKPTVSSILIVRLSALGDVVQSLPLLPILRQTFPNASIGWLVEEGAASLLEGVSEIDRLHISKRKTWLKQIKKPSTAIQAYKELRAFIHEIKTQEYQWAIDVQGLQKSAIWPFLVGVPNRIGFAPGREASDWLYTHRVKAMATLATDRHAMESFLGLLEPLGIEQQSHLSFPEKQKKPTIPKSENTIHSWIKEQKNLQRSILAFAPATQWQSKHWPVSEWRKLCTLLQGKPVSLLWLGGPSDKDLVTSLHNFNNAQPQPIPSLNLCGQTNIAELFTLLEASNIYIGPDSAPLHIANAVSSKQGNPFIIGLYGPTASLRTGPSSSDSLALESALECQPCHKRTCPLATASCMQVLRAENVAAIVGKQLNT